MMHRRVRRAPDVEDSSGPTLFPSPTSKPRARDGSFFEKRKLLLAGMTTVAVVLLWAYGTSQPTTPSPPKELLSTLGSRSSVRSADPETKKGALHQTGQDDTEYQLVFSTSCSDFQNWQSYMVFFNALKMKQPGHVTRIASGCNEEEAAALKDFHAKSVSKMSDKFHLHISPEFRDLAAGNMSKNYQVTKYFNKPYGMWHWMQNSLGYNDQNMYEKEGDAVIILIDPDMLLLRPITRDFTNDTSIRWVKELHNVPRVEHGKPMASVYGFGNKPFQFDLKQILGEDSPALKVTRDEGSWYYPAGPPYIATARDMYAITHMWTAIAPKVHEQHPQMLAEMFSYSIAAAHLELPHQLAKSFMISDDTAVSEGWYLIDDVPAEEMCDWQDENPLPLVLHYCHRSLLGEFVLTKYRLRKDFLSCDAPLLIEPPKDIATKYDYGIEPPKDKGKEAGKKMMYQPNMVKRNAFMLCHLIPQFNEAAEYYKKHNCNGKANFEKTLDLFTDPW